MINEELLEQLSEICHNEWIDWSKNINKDLNETIRILDENIKYLQKEEGNLDLINQTENLKDNLLEKTERWELLWISYEELPEDEKEKDRVYARKILKVIDE